MNRVRKKFKADYAETISYYLEHRSELVMVLMKRRGSTKRNITILIQYITTGQTLAQIGRQYDLTRERVRQIINKQLDKLKGELSENQK